MPALGTTLLTTGVSEITSIVLGLLALLILAGLLFLFAYRAGKEAFLSLIYALYIGLAVYTAFPFTNLFKAAGTSPVAVALSSIVFYAVFTGVAYIVVKKAAGSAYFLFGNIGTLILSLLTAGFLIALCYHTFSSVQDVYTFTPTIKMYFAPAQYFFWWFIAPLIGVLFLAR